MPSTEGIYRQKQPGFSPHPALKNRNKARSSLGRSGSLVLQGTTGLDVGYPGGELLDEQGLLPAIGGAAPIWKQPPFLEEVPARLEGCLQRLAAADKAVSRAAALGAAKQEAEIELLQRQLDEVVKEGPKWQGEIGKAPPGGSPGATMYDRGEPAPEPPGSASYNPEAATPDVASADEMLEAQAAAGSKDLSTQLTTIEGQLLELDKKWRIAETERREGELIRSDLAARLKASEARYQTILNQHNELHQEHKTGEANSRRLEAELAKLQVEAEKLRQDLGVSERTAQELRSEISDLQGRETVLTTQLNGLHAELYAAQSETQALRSSLEATERAKEDLNVRLTNAEAARADAEATHLREKAALDEANVAALAKEAAKNTASSEELSALKTENARSLREKDAVLAEKDAQLREHEVRSKDQVRELSDKLEARERDHAEVFGKHADLEKAHRNEEESRAAAEQKAEDLLKSMNDLQAQLEAARAEAASHSDKVAELASKLEAADAAAVASANQAEKASAAAASAVADAESARNALSGGEDAEASALGRALEEKAAADQKALEAEAAAQDLQTQKKQLEAQLEAAREEAASHRAEADSHRASAEAATKQVEASTKALSVSEAKAAAAEAAAKEAEALRKAQIEEVEKAKLETESRTQAKARDQVLQDVPEQEMQPLSHKIDWEEDDASGAVHHAPKADLLLRASGASDTGCGRPTQCQVDAALQELRLLSLGPVGAPSIIPFADIVGVEKPNDEQDKRISIHWVPNRSTAPKLASPLTVKLLPSDEEAANLLVAALTIYDRAAPGSLLMTPQSITPRSSPPESTAP